MTRREALLSMGYTEARPGKWAKPTGFQLLTYSEATNRWECWFIAATEELCVWDAHTFEDDVDRFGSYLYQLKNWEAYTRHDINVLGDSEMHMRGIDL